MKLTQELIDQIQDALNHTKKDGTVNWQDGDEIEVSVAGTFAADRFIVINNRSKKPWQPSINSTKHPDHDPKVTEDFYKQWPHLKKE